MLDVRLLYTYANPCSSRIQPTIDRPHVHSQLGTHYWTLTPRHQQLAIRNTAAAMELTHARTCKPSRPPSSSASCLYNESMTLSNMHCQTPTSEQRHMPSIAVNRHHHSLSVSQLQQQEYGLNHATIQTENSIAERAKPLEGTCADSSPLYTGLQLRQP
jgi:hypothetical protein